MKVRGLMSNAKADTEPRTSPFLFKENDSLSLRQL
jgi:hypothetical protein